MSLESKLTWQENTEVQGLNHANSADKVCAPGIYALAAMDLYVTLETVEKVVFGVSRAAVHFVAGASNSVALVGPGSVSHASASAQL